MSLILIFCTPRPRDNIYEFSGFCKISPLRGCESLRVETQVMAARLCQCIRDAAGQSHRCCPHVETDNHWIKRKCQVQNLSQDIWSF